MQEKRLTMSNESGTRTPFLTAVAIGAVASVLAAAETQGPPAEGGCPAEPARFHVCALAKAKTFNPPRTPDGRPDLQGFWRGLASGTENIEQHPKTLDDAGGDSLIVDPVDGKVPYQAWAVGLSKENRQKFVEPNVPCFLSGVPRSMYVPTQIEIRQSPGYVVMLFERAHAYRIIPTDGRPHVGENITLWQGDSRGRWDGTTLVVDVTNQNAKPWLDQAGNFYSDAARVVERFTLIDRDTIHYQATLEDPNVYTRPWTIAFPIRRNPDVKFELLEEACHEGERNTQPLIELGYRIYPGVSTRQAK
jgi:hypothetical protein